MVRGFYISGTGMMLQRRMMENVTNNITNADTTGYKKDHLVSHTFDDVLIQRIHDTNVVGQTRFVGPLNFGTQVDQKYTNFTQGGFEQTERTTDLAISGDAFFVMETPAGERYSRDGAFFVNNLGFIVDGDGNFLLGRDGRINVGTEDFSVNESGVVTVDGVQVGAIRLVRFADNGDLRKTGDNLYTTIGALPQEATEAVVKQGFLENSNIDIGREMVDMMTIFRAYETNQKILTMIDETVGKAVNEIARVR